MTIFTATAAMLREADPFRAQPLIPEVRQLNEKYLSLIFKDGDLTPDERAFVDRYEREGDPAPDLDAPLRNQIPGGM